MQRKPIRRPTIATMAGDLGVSPATVSYALNEKPGVSPALRERILAHAREVGWVPNFGAKALRLGLTGNIGLVLVRDPEEISREPYYSSVTAGIESATSASGYELLLRFVKGGTAAELDVYRSWAENRRVDGVVLLDLSVGDPRPRALEDLGMPFAVLGDHSGDERFVKVVTPESSDAQILVDHVLACGYDACIQLTGPMRYGHEKRRADLLREMCADAGIPHFLSEATYTIAGGTEAFSKIRGAEGARAAVIASSDLIALGALREIRSRGIDVPQEMGVISWDDSLIAEVAAPAITALDRTPFAKGRCAGELLARLVRNEVEPGTASTSGPSTLVPRESTIPR